MSMEILGYTVAVELLGVLVATFMAGLCVPYGFGIERLRGFGRWMLMKLPYEPPAEVEVDDPSDQEGAGGG